MQNIQIMEYYLSFKRNLSRASVWINLEDIMLLNNPVTEKQIVFCSTYMSV